MQSAASATWSAGVANGAFNACQSAAGDSGRAGGQRPGPCVTLQFLPLLVHKAPVQPTPQTPADLDAAVIALALQNFHADHCQHRFAVLRERGVQAALKQHLDAADIALRGSHRVAAHMYDRAGNAAYAPHDRTQPQRFDTDRMRLEVHIPEPQDACAPSVSTQRKKNVDLALYRADAPVNDPVRLFNYGHGVGDVIYTCRAQDISAAIEIKASPSYNKHEAVKSGHDMAYLLRLSEQQHIPCTFIVLDKTHAFYGDWVFGTAAPKTHPKAHIRWELCPDDGTPIGFQALLQASYAGSSAQILQTPFDLLLSRHQPADRCYVTVYHLSSEDGLRPLYAYRQRADGAVPAPSH